MFSSKRIAFDGTVAIMIMSNYENYQSNAKNVYDRIWSENSRINSYEY